MVKGKVAIANRGDNRLLPTIILQPHYYYWGRSRARKGATICCNGRPALPSRRPFPSGRGQGRRDCVDRLVKKKMSRWHPQPTEKRFNVRYNSASEGQALCYSFAVVIGHRTLAARPPVPNASQGYVSRPRRRPRERIQKIASIPTQGGAFSRSTSEPD